MKRIIALLFICLFTSTTFAQDDEKAWSFSLDQSISDKYVWRGIQYNEEGVNQGSADLSYDTGDLGTFGINVWYNLDLDNENANGEHSGSGSFSEVDYTLYWEKGFDALTLGAGIIYYDFSEVNAGSTKEVYVSASYDTFLAPSENVYYDFEDVDGFYVDFSIGHSIDLGVLDATLDLGASIGYADDDMASAYYSDNTETAGSGFSNYALSAAVNFPLLENVTLTPSIMYYSLLEDANDVGYEDDDFVFGINLNLSF
ncbi:MAG: hypothetical protein NE330_17985 [Lentisphaeraceae bacterium]|nr:hypothetical protein [Lentisphaeraceae bacterium]